MKGGIHEQVHDPKTMFSAQLSLCDLSYIVQINIVLDILLDLILFTLVQAHQ